MSHESGLIHLKISMPNSILRFTASWCQPCKALTAMLNEVQLTVPMRVIDIDKEEHLVKEYQVRSIPTLIQIQDGKVTSRLVGAVTKAELEDWLATATS